MDVEIGIACGQCDAYSPFGTPSCPACGHKLSIFATQPPPPLKRSSRPRITTAGSKLAKLAMGLSSSVPPPNGGNGESSRPASGRLRPSSKPAAKPAPATVEQAAAPLLETSVDETAKDHPTAAIARPDSERALGGNGAVPKNPALSPHVSASSLVESSYASLSQEELMEQARTYVCKSCSTPVPLAHKFCGRCGDAVPPEILGARTMFFSDMQNPAKAKLILIRGEGMDGLSFHLKAEHHIVGRNGQLVFPDDAFISPRHADFFYRDGRLVVRDEGSLNGVYLRVRGTIEITAGDQFLAGEQLFRLDLTPRPSDGPDTDGTYFYSSPKHPSAFRVTQMLEGGVPGMVICTRTQSLQIGREGGEINFPDDLYMSAAHCRIEEAGGKFSLTDMGSRNGTYLRLKTERELGHGDYLFIGRKLLRVELNSN
jgi:pSer/pThr/pTyr-binding forkhead associated (FHA) protein